MENNRTKKDTTVANSLESFKLKIEGGAVSFSDCCSLRLWGPPAGSRTQTKQEMATALITTRLVVLRERSCFVFRFLLLMLVMLLLLFI